MSDNQGSSRRTFHIACIYGLWSVIGGMLAIPAAVYLLFPPRPRKENQWVEATDVADLPSNTPEEVVFRRTRFDGWKITSEKSTAWVIKRSANDVIAFAPQCTHLGCAYHWVDEKREFLCPCHNSTFALDGTVTSGPAQRPLDRHELRIENGKLLIGPVVRSDQAV